VEIREVEIQEKHRVQSECIFFLAVPTKIHDLVQVAQATSEVPVRTAPLKMHLHGSSAQHSTSTSTPAIH